MAEITISVPDECAELMPDYTVNECRRLLLGDSLREAAGQVIDLIESRGADDQRPDELRQVAEKVRRLADELATAQDERAGKVGSLVAVN
jgi:hypothetical protein